jgi:hypothetical protein
MTDVIFFSYAKSSYNYQEGKTLRLGAHEGKCYQVVRLQALVILGHYAGKIRELKLSLNVRTSSIDSMEPKSRASK